MSEKQPNIKQEDEGLPPEIDKELKKIIETFDRGEGSEERRDSGSMDSDFLKRATARYEWRKDEDRGKQILFDTKEKREINEEEQVSLLKKAKQGNREAADLLMRMNIGLVYFVFKDPARSFSKNDPDNLLAAGLEGLWEAIQNHDPSRGVFSTYAVGRITSMMQRAQKEGPMYIPEHAYYEGDKFHHLINPQQEDVYDKNVQETNPDYLQARREESPERLLEKKRLIELINSMSDILTSREKKVLRFRFNNEMTLEEAGKELNTTGENVRQIQERALRKLRRSPQAELLHPFWEE